VGHYVAMTNPSSMESLPSFMQVNEASKMETLLSAQQYDFSEGDEETAKLAQEAHVEVLGVTASSGTSDLMTQPTWPV
jgi:hypothetical protein